MPRFSLSTLLIAATATALLTWLNVKPSQSSQEQIYAPLKGSGGLRKLAVAVHADRGWPVSHTRTTTYTDIPNPYGDVNHASIDLGEVFPIEYDERPVTNWARATFDFAIAISLLLLAVIGFELYLRRTKSGRLKTEPG